MMNGFGKPLVEKNAYVNACNRAGQPCVRFHVCANDEDCVMADRNETPRARSLSHAAPPLFPATPPLEFTPPPEITAPVTKPRFDSVNAPISEMPQRAADQYRDTQAELKKKVARVPLDLVCPVGLIYEAQAMREGFLKYGYASFLNDNVEMTARGCIGAAMRHLERLLNGEDFAPEPNATHHAGHARAMLGIYLECMAAGKLIDDRHTKRGYVGKVMDDLAKKNAQ